MGSALYRGGITVTEDEIAFTLFGGSGYKLIQTSGFSVPNQLRFYASNVEQYRIGASGVFTWYDGAGGTRMTLNSTGLGVGGAPISGFRLNVNNGDFRVSDAQNEDGVEIGWSPSAGGLGFVQAYNRTTSAFKDLVLNAAVTINTAGNVGIGVTPSAWASTWKAIQVGAIGSLSYSPDDTGYTISTSNGYWNGSNWIRIAAAAVSAYSQNQGKHSWLSAASSSAGSTIAFGDAKMTLDASGNLLVGTTGTVVSSDSRFRVSATAVPAVDAKTTAATQAVVDEWNSDTSGDNLFNRFWTESSPIAFRGSISYNRAGGLVAYNTTSDYRAKDIIGPVSNSGSLIDSLKVYVGKMKGATIERPMLIAHELQEVAPYAVSGEKDAVDADGKPKYQQMDASALVPLLIAEIKSLRARVQTLETR